MKFSKERIHEKWQEKKSRPSAQFQTDPELKCEICGKQCASRICCTVTGLAADNKTTLQVGCSHHCHAWQTIANINININMRLLLWKLYAFKTCLLKWVSVAKFLPEQVMQWPVHTAHNVPRTISLCTSDILVICHYMPHMISVPYTLSINKHWNCICYRFDSNNSQGVETYIYVSNLVPNLHNPLHGKQ